MTEALTTRNQRYVIRQSLSEAGCSQVHPPGPHKHGLLHQQKAMQLLEENSAACQVTPVTKDRVSNAGRKQDALPSLHL